MKLHVYVLSGEVCWPRLLPVGAGTVVLVTCLGEGEIWFAGNEGSQRESAQQEPEAELGGAQEELRTS